MKTETIAGIEYIKPKVFLLQESGIGVANYAGRQAYKSFDKDENKVIAELASLTTMMVNHAEFSKIKNELNSTPSSNLLDQLAHVYHHDSVLEHINLSYLVKGISRGVLQEVSRHRIGTSLTVQSTRYTGQAIINTFISSTNNTDSKEFFVDNCFDLNMLTITGEAAHQVLEQLYDNLLVHFRQLNYNYSDVLSKEALATLNQSLEASEQLKLLNASKDKRNSFDTLKWLVNESWSVDLVVTFNLRSLTHFLKLRDSNAAYFGIKNLAEAIIEATPQKYLDLVSKKYK